MKRLELVLVLGLLVVVGCKSENAGSGTKGSDAGRDAATKQATTHPLASRPAVEKVTFGTLAQLIPPKPAGYSPLGPPTEASSPSGVVVSATQLFQNKQAGRMLGITFVHSLADQHNPQERLADLLRDGTVGKKVEVGGFPALEVTAEGGAELTIFAGQCIVTLTNMGIANDFGPLREITTEIDLRALAALPAKH
jgi:hypothetical protein